MDAEEDQVRAPLLARARHLSPDEVELGGPVAPRVDQPEAWAVGARCPVREVVGHGEAGHALVPELRTERNGTDSRTSGPLTEAERPRPTATTRRLRLAMGHYLPRTY